MHPYIRSALYLVHEARLPDVGKPREQQRAGVGVEGGQTREMPPDLLEVGQGRLLPLEEGAHSTKSGPLQLLTPVEGVTCAQKCGKRHVKQGKTCAILLV